MGASSVMIGFVKEKFRRKNKTRLKESFFETSS